MGEYTGVLSNLSEGGLAVNSRFPEIQGKVFGLVVELPDSSSPMPAAAQTTWISDSENRTGVRFIHLPATSRQQLREWMSAQTTATVKEWPPTFRALARVAQFNFAVHRQLTARRHVELRRLTGLVLTVTTLCSASALLGYHLASRSEYQRTRTLAPAATTAELHARGEVEPAKPSPETNPSPYTVPPLEVPGFVLQVGAMKNLSNAEALSETLHRKNFPAFVFKGNTDRFYIVEVGSFANADSAAVVKRKLEEQGFKAVLRYWSPY